jgi:cytochrome P450
MALDATIVEVPKPPAGRLPFLRLLARLVSNPVASWGEDFYDEPIVVYRDFGLETVFVIDPELTQQILLDDSDAFTKSPHSVLGRAGGKGLLIAEGEDWRWQRRIAAPLFRAEAILSYARTFAAACEPVLASWRKAEPGSLQIIGKDMTDAAMQALQDTILGADLGKQERKMVSEAGTAFLSSTTWKIAYASLKLPSWTPHPGSSTMRRAGDNLREVAGRVLANRRQGRGDGLIIDNVVTFLMVGQETTAQALTWALYVLALFPEWQDKVRDEVRRVIGAGPLGANQLEQLGLLEAVFMEAMRLYPPARA